MGLDQITALTQSGFFVIMFNGMLVDLLRKTLDAFYLLLVLCYMYTWFSPANIGRNFKVYKTPPESEHTSLALLIHISHFLIVLPRVAHDGSRGSTILHVDLMHISNELSIGEFANKQFPN